MSDNDSVVNRVVAEDLLGRRGFIASVDRARAFGSNSLSGMLDIVGGLVLVLAGVLVAMIASNHSPGVAEDSDWLVASLVAICGGTCGLLLFALSRLVTYGKACAVLLAKLSAAEN